MKTTVVGAVALIVGTLIGTNLGSGRYLDGRLSACKDVASMFPAAQIECRVISGEVYFTSPDIAGKWLTLDGKLKD